MNKTVAYIRISTGTQDTNNQRLAILDYAQREGITIAEIVEVEVSTRRSRGERGLDYLFSILEEGDRLICLELSRLGRSMIEVINLVEELGQKGVEVLFIRQPELSTSGPHGRLLLAIYGYLAETERELISQRTRDALAARKRAGVKLGRPKGSRGRNRVLDPYRESILDLLRAGLSLRAVRKAVNSKMEGGPSYSTYRYYVNQDRELKAAWGA